MQFFTITNLQRNFQELGLSLAAKDCFAMLDQAHSEPNRFYHNTQHIEDCLQQLEAHKKLSENPLLVELALWFHDAVYDPQQKENEEKSAELAFQMLKDSGLAEQQRQQIKELILATRHNHSPSSRDAKLLVDIDLSILGRQPERFDQYNQNIRKEYAWVSEVEYRKGRRTLLEAFLARPFIYQTAFYREKYEKIARENIQRAITELTGSD